MMYHSQGNQEYSRKKLFPTLSSFLTSIKLQVTIVTIGEVIDSPGNVRLTHDAVLAAEALAYPGPFVSSSTKKSPLSARQGDGIAQAPSTVSQRVRHFDALQGGGSAGKGASRSRSVGALSRDLGREMDAAKGSNVGRILDGGDRRQMDGRKEMDGADEKSSRGRPRGSINGGELDGADRERREINGGAEIDGADEDFGMVGGNENRFSGLISEVGRSGWEVWRGEAESGGQKERTPVTKRQKNRGKEEGLVSSSVAKPNGSLVGRRDPDSSDMVLLDAGVSDASEPEADVLVKNALVMEPQRREAVKRERGGTDGFARTESGSDGPNVRRKAGAVTGGSLGREDEAESRRGPDVGIDAEEVRIVSEVGLSVFWRETVVRKLAFKKEVKITGRMS
jgi:hypothetical protein